MEWVETTGRSVEEAKDAALDQLGVDESDAEFVVVSEPRQGLFGRVRGEARVRARVRPTKPRPKKGRTRRQVEPARTPARRSRSSDRDTRRDVGSRSVRVSEVGLEAPQASSAAANGSGDAVVPDGDEGSSGRPVEVRTGASGSGGRGPRGRRRRGPGDSGSRTRATTDQPHGPGADLHRDTAQRGAGKHDRPGRVGTTKEEPVGEDLSVEEQGESAREFVDGLVGLLGIEASVTVAVVDTDTAQVSVEGPELGVLIGPGGGTLAALQELARTVVQRRTGGRTDRILIDVAGYRAKRAAALQRFTEQVAQEVLTSLEERALEPMSAADRKVVHDTVNDIEGVVTRSVGEEPRRYVVVAPAPEHAEVVGADEG